MNEELRRDINAMAELVMWISKEHGPAYQMAKRVLDAVSKPPGPATEPAGETVRKIEAVICHDPIVDHYYVAGTEGVDVRVVADEQLDPAVGRVTILVLPIPTVAARVVEGGGE